MSRHAPRLCAWFFLLRGSREMATQMTTNGRNANPAAANRALELLTQEDAAALLHKSPRVLRFWRTAGIGPAYVKLRTIYNQ